MTKNYYRLCVSAGVIGNVLFEAGGRLPVGKPMVLLMTLGITFIAVWLAAIYAFHREDIGILGRVGFFTLVFSVLAIIFRNILLFFVWEYGLEELEALWDTPAWFIINIGEFVYIWSVIALGTECLRIGKLPRGSTILWFLGLILLPLNLASALLIAGVIWSGSVLWKKGEPSDSGDFGTKLPPQPEEGELLATPSRSSRIIPLDATRGLIIILMAIDHASLLIRKAHSFELYNLPIPNYDSAAAFLTRFVTHICAPGFFFLMGAGMMLLAESRLKRGWSYGKIVRHLFSRGLMLIALEQLLLDPVLYNRIILTEFGVLFGLGGVLIVGILFLRLGSLPLLGIGSGLILITQVLPKAMIDIGINYPPAVRLFFVPGTTGDWFTIYPVIPWLGIAALGMAFGRQLLKDREIAYRQGLQTGLILLVLFMVVRSVGGFGNFKPAIGSGWIDYLNVVKYPPSLGFTLFTLGIDLVLIYIFHRVSAGLAKWGKPLLVFGQTALFTYFMHWFMLAGLGDFFPVGTSLIVMYAGWALALVALYPISLNYGRFKRSTKPESVWRLA
jgi:uncharacterized membrane protein